MTGAVFVIAINMVIATTMAAAFFAVGHFDANNRAAKWLGVAFVLAMLSFAGEYVLHTGLSDAGARLFIALAMLGCFLAIAHALARRYEAPLSPLGLGMIFLASSILYLLILELPREDMWRQVLYQTPYGLVSLMGAIMVSRSQRREPIDRVLFVMLVLVALSFAAKPVVAHFSGGVGAVGRDYATTLYALISQSSGAVVTLLLAMVCLAMVVSDAARSLVRKSERDPLTGLLNQNGFEQHGSRLVAVNPGAQNDLALVLFSFDGPHARDDQSSPALSAALSDIFGPGALVARMSGPYFAALLPGTNLFAARRHAEILRSRLAEGVLPIAAPVMAAIGIAEREPGDSLLDLLVRGQWAHREALDAGGDCVRLAARAAFVPARSTTR